MTNRQNVWLRKKIDQQVQKFGGCCSICGSVIDLEFAHIKPTGLSGEGRGRWRRYYDRKYHPNCYLLLCSNCHEMFDTIRNAHAIR